jgi:4-amino-4-deoxy-L-arabinose transferase-like glycosyltransferase
MRWLIALCQLTLASICLTAGFTAAAVLLLLSIVLTGLTAPVRTLRFRLVTLCSGFVVVALVWSLFGALAGEKGSTATQVYERLDSLRKTVLTGEITKDTSKATSGRLDLGLISIDSFLRSPLIGLGKGKESQTIAGHTSDTIGGHSYILDSLGQRGLIGTFPLLVAIGSFVITAYRSFRKAEGSWRESAMLTMILMWIVAMIINPYFLGYLALNCVVFLCFGLILGDAARLQLASKSARHRPGRR